MIQGVKEKLGPAAEVPSAAATPDVSGTVAAAAQSTVQVQPAAQGSAPPAATAGVSQPTILLDESFGTSPQGWPNQPGGTAWYADGAYRLQTREAGQFIVLNAPLTDVVHDIVVSARFRKTGGPSGGGYGLVVADQGPNPHDGMNQGGRFVALEAVDQGIASSSAVAETLVLANFRYRVEREFRIDQISGSGSLRSRCDTSAGTYPGVGLRAGCSRRRPGCAGHGRGLMGHRRRRPRGAVAG